MMGLIFYGQLFSRCMHVNVRDILMSDIQIRKGAHHELTYPERLFIPVNHHWLVYLTTECRSRYCAGDDIFYGISPLWRCL